MREEKADSTKVFRAGSTYFGRLFLLSAYFLFAATARPLASAPGKFAARPVDISFWNSVMPKSRPTTPSIAPGIYENLVSEWFYTVSTEPLISMSATPFYWIDHIAQTDKNLVEDFYGMMQGSPRIRMDFAYVGHISVADIRSFSPPGWLKHVEYSMFQDRDLVILMSYYRGADNGALFICTRSQGGQPKIVGWWHRPSEQQMQEFGTPPSGAWPLAQQFAAPESGIAFWNSIMPKARPTTPAIAPVRFNSVVKTWLQGFSANSLDQLTSMSAVPFYYRGHASNTEVELRNDYRSSLAYLPPGRIVDAAYIGHISVRDMRTSRNPFLNPSQNAMFRDSDLVALMAYRYGSGQGFDFIYFRQQGQQLKIIGFGQQSPPQPPPSMTTSMVRSMVDTANMMVLTVSDGPSWMLGTSPVRRIDLANSLLTLYGRRADKRLGIKAPGQMPYRQLITVIDAAIGAGVGDIFLAADQSFIPSNLSLGYFPAKPVPPMASRVAIPGALNFFDAPDRDFETCGIVINAAGQIFVGANAVARENALKAAITAVLRSTSTPFSYTGDLRIEDGCCFFVDGALTVRAFADILSAFQALGPTRSYLMVRRN